MGSRAQAQQLWLTGLVALRHVGSSWTGARTRVACIDRRILNHCATREALLCHFHLTWLVMECFLAFWQYKMSAFQLVQTLTQPGTLHFFRKLVSVLILYDCSFLSLHFEQICHTGSAFLVFLVVCRTTKASSPC